jgi:O-antigen ligase
MAAIIVVLMLATIVYTKSRGGVLGLVVMLMVLLLLAGKIRRGFGVVALIAVVTAMPFLPSSFVDRIVTIFDEKADRQEFSGSREARLTLMREGIATFKERPLTGVGAGQFPNHDPTGRKQPWRQTHNTPIQIAAELGIVGLLTFVFLIVRAAMAGPSTRRMLRRSRRRRGADAVESGLTDDDRQYLYAHTVAMTAGLAGWLACAMFASVAYNWTFYYLLALTVAARELTRDRMVARAATVARTKRTSAPATPFRRMVPSTG